MDHFSPPQPAIVKPIKKRKKRPIFPIIFLILIYIILVIWMNIPITKHFLGMDPPTATPSVTPTFFPTRTPRPTFTPTITPTATVTPLPASRNQIADVNNLNPPINGLNPNSIVMDVMDATVYPPLDNPQWSPGSKAIPGTILSDSIYITQGSGSVIWKLDVPLTPGLYKVYVMDTLFGSAGALDFSVKEGDTPLTPLTDSTRVRFASSQSETNPQSGDQWHSIGIYDVSGTDLLSVSSAWEPRDIYTLVALDRILIEPLPAGDRELLSKLDSDRTRIIVDDLDAVIDGNPLLITRDDNLSWNGNFQSITNPEKDVKVTYTMPYAVNRGQYEVKLWMPGAHHSGSFDISIKVNDTEISSGKLPTVKETEYSGGSWVSIGGVWDSSSTYDTTRVKYSITFTIKGGSVGETGLDAVAFLGLPSNDATPTPSW